MSLDLALMIFEHIEGAERAYADVLDASVDAPWVHAIAFVEHHRPLAARRDELGVALRLHAALSRG